MMLLIRPLTTIIRSRRLTIGATPTKRRPSPSTLARPSGSAQASLLLEIAPALHGDFAGVEFAAFLVARLARAFLLAHHFARVAPGEVVEVPVGVGGEDQVPDGQGAEVDQHPEDVGEFVRGDYDEHAR